MKVRTLRRAGALSGAALLAACAPQQKADTTANATAPANAASPAAAADVPTPTPAPSAEPNPGPTLTRDVGEPAVPTPGAPLPTTGFAEGPFAPDSGQAGADVVQTYVALLEQGKVRQALKLWGDGDAPDPASLNRYGEFHANVGGPGRIEGAAGSRYVTVPVHFYGTMRNGKPFVEDGTVTLRRSAVDGATADQKRWRIYSVDVKPAPRR